MHAAWQVGFRYFVVVFGFGFVFGVIRTLWVVPRLGERNAELIDISFMVLVIAVSADSTAKRLKSVKEKLLAGAIALALMVGAELWFVLRLRNLTLRGYLEQRDPVSGTLYLIALVYFALAPALAGLRRRSDSREA